MSYLTHIIFFDGNFILLQQFDRFDGVLFRCEKHVNYPCYAYICFDILNIYKGSFELNDHKSIDYCVLSIALRLLVKRTATGNQAEPGILDIAIHLLRGKVILIELL